MANSPCTSQSPVIVAARRTPIATRGRALADRHLEDLAAPVIRAGLTDATSALNTHPDVADVILGNCMGPGGNPGRIAALAAGLGKQVPGATIDRQCGSGLAAIIHAGMAITAGDTRAYIAGGVESASTAPIRSMHGVPYNQAPFVPAGWEDPGMIEAADALARADQIDRSRQEQHSLRSCQRARTAQKHRVFDQEIVPIHAVDRDEIPARLDAVLARLAPINPGGSVTAATATRISDGATAVVLVPEECARGVAGLRLRSWAIVGCDPRLPGIGAAPAVQAAVAKAGVSLSQIVAFEIVEAFAAQSLAVLSRLGLADDDPRVCSDGGALALGHPWGASSAVSVVRLFSRLVRAGAPAGACGVAAASIAGGMGIAAVMEVVR
ncbi:thiolase family protein [Devriesea agamarum]|uniref:thiolase family protein n=1 Tax=Devriesea agamarum TaxID=472569 RepID=UPI000AA06D58|nr:thiolase family protein [Devriesea agamarum]